MIIDGTNGLTFNNATTQASGGKVIQVVNAQFDNPAQVTTTSSTPSSTVLTATITPLFATSKILAMTNTQIVNNASTNYGFVAIYRNGTVSLGWNSVVYCASGGSVWVPTTNISYDAPATTSATTYTLYIKAGSGQLNVFWGSGTSSTITLMEISA